MGGDELAFLLPGLDGGGATVVGHRVCAAAAAVLGPHGASLSVGLALPVPGESAHSCLERADQALYEAKRAGRGRVILSRAGPTVWA